MIHDEVGGAGGPEATAAPGQPGPTEEDLLAWHAQVLRLEAQGRVTRTFRRLDPQRQLAVMDAITAEAAAHGPRGLQVSRVAARAEVSVGSLYQYFPQRAGMLEAAVEVTAGYFTAAMDSYTPQVAAAPLREGLLAYLTSGVEWAAGQPGTVGLFAQAAYAGDPAYIESLVRPAAEAMRRMLRALLSAAQRRGELRPGIDLETAVRLVQVLTTAVGDAELVPHLDEYYRLFDPDHPPARIRKATVDFVIRAIGREEAP